MTSNNVIIISDVFEMRKRKEEELAYYQTQLQLLQQKMWFVQQEIDVTNHIINLIEKEKTGILNTE